MGILRGTSLAALVLTGCSHVSNIFETKKDFSQTSMEVCAAVAQRQGTYGLMQGQYGASVALSQNQTGISAMYTFGDAKEKKIISIVDQDCNGGLNIAQICDLASGVCKVYSDRESLLPLYTSVVEQMHNGLRNGSADFSQVSTLYEKAITLPTSISFEGSMTATHGAFELIRHTNVTIEGNVTDRTYIIKKGDYAILFHDGGTLGDLDKVRACRQDKETVCKEPSIDDAMPLYMRTKAALEDKRAFDDEFVTLFEEFFKVR